MLNEIGNSNFDTRYIHLPHISKDDFLLCYKENLVLVKKLGNDYEIPRKCDFTEIPGSLIYLFSINSHHCFGGVINETNNEKLEFQDIFILRNLKNKEFAWMGSLGYQLVNWYEHNRFCGRCGASTEHKAEERALVCPECQAGHFP